MQTRAPEPGDRIGTYLLERKLGEGGMGLVFEALDMRDEKTRVAVKVLKPESAEELIEISRFEREARLGAQIKSPYVVRLLDAGLSDTKLPYIVMELVPARDMAHEIRAGRMPTRGEMMRWMVQLLEVLAEAHRLGIIHRDVKPSNILIDRSDPARTCVKLADFGISKDLAGAKLTETGMFVGTPRYMAPELILNPKEIDGRADLWSVGVILYEYLSGRTPFAGSAAVDIVANLLSAAPLPLGGVDPMLASVVMESLEKDPNKRPRSAEAYAARLSPFVDRADAVDPFGPTVTVDAMISSRGTPGAGSHGSVTHGKKKRTNVVLFAAATACGASLAAVAVAVIAPRLFSTAPVDASSGAPSAALSPSAVVLAPLAPASVTAAVEPTPSIAPLASAKPAAPLASTRATFRYGSGFVAESAARQWAVANRAGVDACVLADSCHYGYDIGIRATGQCQTTVTGTCSPDHGFYRCIAVLVGAHPFHPSCAEGTTCEIHFLVPMDPF